KASGQVFTEAWRSNLLQYVTNTRSYLAALGALAAGEFLAQPVLSRIFSVVQQLYPNADVEYFTTHLELESDHMREIAALLARQAQLSEAVEDVTAGFVSGLEIWGDYFASLSEYLFGAAPNR